MAENENVRRIVKIAVELLPPQRHPTPEELEQALALALQLARIQGIDAGEHEVRRWLEAKVSVTQDDSVGMVDPDQHVDWLRQAREDRDWAFWERYERYLTDVLDRPLRVVRSIDQSTDQVLGDLEDPRRPGVWQRKGLVIGQVQSGKTGQFIGLAAKAADAGYRLIVILAGVLDDLRAQTQARIDEGLLGFDSQYQRRSAETRSRIGVGALPGSERLAIATLTNSEQKGDFKKAVAARANIPIGEFPVVLVIKKHPRIIDYVRTWMTEVMGTENPETGEKIVKDVPLFLIDDEADNASINTNDASQDPTSINRSIRDLLNSFGRSSYVGYTATPFANIYIDPFADHPRFGEDLFPASFIRTLRAPSNYLGPERLFGLSQLGDDPEDETDPLPLVRHVDDAASWIPARHRASHRVTEDMPASLQRAIDAFVLVCAARRARGQVSVHNSMLVHVTRFTNVQKQVAEQVRDYLYLMQQDLSQRFGSADLRMDSLRVLWERDFEPTTAQFPAGTTESLEWEDVLPHVQSSAKKIHVKEVNGAAKDVLEYYENREEGLSVIAVGGQKLSRGLTLEGLSVSYYLRLSTTYDTLLQMGRWFGYRPGYEDLCRLWMTVQLESAYREITRATDELRRDVEEMAVLRQKPSEYGLKIQTSSLGLSITAANKSRDGTRVRVSYQGELAETTIFPLRGGVPQDNFVTLEEFVRHLDREHEREGDTGAGLTWHGVSAEEVATWFYDRYRTAKEATRVKPDLIAKYIRAAAERDELGDWTVRVVSSRRGGVASTIAGLPVVPVTRRHVDDEMTNKSPRMTIKRILSPAHESIDLTDEQRRVALAATKRAAAGKHGRDGRPLDPKIPTGAPLRQQRGRDQALLLIYPVEVPATADLGDVPFLVGFAASFPPSDPGQGIEYLVNASWFDVDSFGEDEDEA